MRLLLLAALASVCIAQNKPDPDKGNEVFDEQCAQCHNAYSEARKAGPGLKLLFVRLKESAVREKIDKGGKGMPAFKDSLSGSDKTDLIAYLQTL
ncbi:MAG: cytochrome c [Acidobacteriota bacterium]|nr:cytochrome c [Acidobacteriota bacterium]